MAAYPSANRSMFWRIVRRLVLAHRGRLFVILLALSAGAAVCAALLNLQVDAKHRISTEFRSFGANVLIVPRSVTPGASPASAGSFDYSSVYERIPKKNGADLVSKVSLLYGVVTAGPWDLHSQAADPSRATAAVMVGYQFYGSDLSEIFPATVVAQLPARTIVVGNPDCQLGERLANQLGVHLLQFVEMRTTRSTVHCYVTRISRYGGPEDNQIFIELHSAQGLLDRGGQTSLVALNVPGTPASVVHYVAALQTLVPDAEVRPVRQFTEAQGKIYTRISGLLTATVAVVLLLTALCVLAAMTNVAMERKQDVAMMKAIGGSVRRVVRIFLAEAVLLGLAGGLIGAAAGMGISMVLGKAVFGIAARPRLIVYPVSVSLTLLVAVLSSYPLRHLARVRPASIFRGEA